MRGGRRAPRRTLTRVGDEAGGPGGTVGLHTGLIGCELDRRLVERTVALYEQLTGQVAAGRLRAALDSSPLWGQAG